MAKKYYNSKKMSGRGGMISDDYSAPALLPKGVMEKDYEMSYGGMYGYSGGDVPDLYSGVSKQLSEENREFKKIMDPSKY